MKKIITLLSVLFLFVGTMSAQSDWHGGISAKPEQGQWFISGGLSANYMWTIFVLPISISGDYVLKSGLFDDNGAVSVGAYTTTMIGSGLTVLSVGPRVSVHYNFVEWLDTYATLSVGYWGAVSGSISGSLAYGFNIGARYYFKPKWGLFGELGYGLGNAKFGITYRF